VSNGEASNIASGVWRSLMANGGREEKKKRWRGAAKAWPMTSIGGDQYRRKQIVCGVIY